MQELSSTPSLKSGWAKRRRKLVFESGKDVEGEREGSELSPTLPTERMFSNSSFRSLDGISNNSKFLQESLDAIEQLRQKQMNEIDEACVDRYAAGTPIGDRVILLFDEDEYESKHTRQVLDELNCTVVYVSEQDQAVRTFQRFRGDFDAIILGMRGPGYETIRFLETVSPVKMPVILTLSVETSDLSFLGSEAPEVNSPMSPLDMYSSVKSLTSSMSFLMRRENTSKLVSEAIELGVSVYMLKPINKEALERRLQDMMVRFRSAAQEFKRMTNYSDPDYSTKQAKQLMLEEIERHKESPKAVAGYVVNNENTKRATRILPSVDVQGRGTRMSKFNLALKRSKAAHNARQRVERASVLRRLESNFTVNTKDPARKSLLLARRRSSALPSGNNSNQRAVKTFVHNFGGQTANSLEARDSSKRPSNPFGLRKSIGNSDPKMMLSVVADLAQKKNKAEGSLPLLVDFRGQISYIQLPWEKERLKNIEKEYGSIPRVKAEDILQSEFREHVPTSKSATSGQRYLQKGYELKIKGDLLGAIRLYTRATLADQRYSAAHLCRGVAYHLLGDEESAMQDFTQCLKIDPKSTSARFNRALIFSHENRDYEAIAELDEAIAIDNKDDGLIAFRAFISRRSGQFARAQEDYKRAADLSKKRLEKEAQVSMARAERRKERRRERRRQMRGSREVGDSDTKNSDSEDSDADGDHDVKSNSPAQASSNDAKDGTSLSSKNISADNGTKSNLDAKSGVAQEDSEGSEDHHQDEVNNGVTGNNDQTKPGQANTQRRWDTNFDGRVDLAEFTSATQRCDSVYAEIFQKKSEVEIACSKPTSMRSQQELDLIFRACREIVLFRKMPQRYVRELAREIKLASVMPGDYVVQQGAPSYNFFAILEGEVQVTVGLAETESDHIVHRMYQGEYFGETGIMTDSCRQVSISVPSDSEPALIFVISKDLFFQTHLGETLEYERLRKRDVLLGCRIFDGMAQQAFEDLCKITRSVEHQHNTIILRQGELTSKFCILVSGICRKLRYSDAGADLRKRIRGLEHSCEQFEMSYAVHHNHSHDIRTQTRVKRVRELHEERLREIEVLRAKLKALECGEIRPGKPKLVETGTIYPGNIIGEEALLDPYYGREQYTVVADTFVTLMCVHKEQLQAYKYSETLLEKVRLKRSFAGAP